MIFRTNTAGESPLHVAVRCGVSSSVASFIKLAHAAFDRPMTPESRRFGNLTSYVNAKCHLGRTPLGCVMGLILLEMPQGNVSAHFNIAMQNYVAIAAMLIAAGATVDKDTFKIIADLSIRYRRIEQVDNLTLLVELSVETPSKYLYGNTMACVPAEVFKLVCIESKVEMLEKLIESNIDIPTTEGGYNVDDENDKLHYANEYRRFQL